MFLLNDGRITRIPDVANHRATAIDLSLISPELAPDCNWKTGEDSLGSDHLPLFITLYKDCTNEDIQEDKIPKYNYNKADWENFRTVLSKCKPEDIINENVDTFYNNLCVSILKAADNSIPKYKMNKSKKYAGNVWWCKTCEEAVNYKKRNI